MNDLKEIGGFIVSADPYVNHDNSLSGNGTLTSPLGVVPGYNETVLWSGTPVASVSGNYITLSENITGFETIKVTMGNDTWATVSEFPSYVNRFECQRIARDSQSYSIIDLAGLYKDASDPLKWVSQGGVRITFTGNAIQNTNLTGMFVRSVIGINRKEQ